MKTVKKRVNIIAIMMFIVFTMMLMMDFLNSLNEKEHTQQDLAQTKPVENLIITEFE